MSKKKNKEFDIPRGTDKQKPTMRTSSRKSKNKLGRGFSDMMATPTPVEKKKSKAADETISSKSVVANNGVSQDVNRSASGFFGTDLPSSVPSSGINNGYSQANPMDSFAPVDGFASAGAAGVGYSTDDTIVGGVPINSSFAKTQQIPKIAESGVATVTDTDFEAAATGLSTSDTLSSGISASDTLASDIPAPEEQLGMDEASIESVITGNPKSKSGVESRAERKKKRRRKKAKITLIVISAIIVIAGLVTGGVMLYTSDTFKIERIEINGALHLKEDEVLKLANVPEDVTLLQVDTDTIITRLKRDAWVQDVKIDKKFPDTLVINVIERPITAIVEVPTTKESGSSVSTSTSATSKNTTVRMWAISADRIWLMPIPDQNSEVGKSLNQQIYADVAGIMHIVDVLPSVNPEIGCYCTDPTVQCAIDVVASMTTELKSQVKYVKASDSQSATLILNNGVEVAVGTNEDMRDKERIVLELLQKHEGKISFINVRNINNPTWRSL